MIRMIRPQGTQVQWLQSGMTENRSGDITIPYCSDLFRYEFLGAADCWRGRVIRALMWLMDFWPLPKAKR